MSNDPLGYGKPPRNTQFQKGRSGNPRGRPHNRRRDIPYDHVLGQMVTIRDDGRERRITAAEAFLLHLTKKGLEGCGASARSSLEAIEAARRARGQDSGDPTLVIRIVAFGICSMINKLGIGVTLSATSKEKARLKLKPWIVELALARMAPGALDVEEQRTVVAATRTPAKVRWPDWWSVHG